MGKFKNKGVGGIKRSRNVPLAEQLLEEKSVRPPGREKQRRRQEEEDDVCNSYYRPPSGTLNVQLHGAELWLRVWP